jgi:hypothetical protein
MPDFAGVSNYPKKDVARIKEGAPARIYAPQVVRRLRAGAQISMSMRARPHAELLTGVANKSTSELLAGLEGERIISLPEVSRLAGISTDTIKRRFSSKILRLSDKRLGMRLRDALNLAQPLNVA